MSEVLLRQMAMLKMLPRPPRRVGTNELKARLREAGFETTPRTIQRDLQALASFFAIECQDDTKPFGWRWQQDAPVFELPVMDPKTALTLKLSAAFLGRVLPQQTFARLKGHLEHAEKVLDGVPDNKLAAWPKKIRVLGAGLPVTYPKVSTEILDVVTSALLEDRRFKCTYQRRDGEVRDHEVNPLALVYRDALGVLICTLNKHESPVTLAPHRIRTAELVAGARRVPKDFDLDAFMAAGGTGFLLEREPIRLIALVHVKAVPTISELPIDAGQTITPHDENRCLLQATVSNTMELRRWIAGFGDAIEVLSPEPLRAKMRDIFSELAERYARTSGAEATAAKWDAPHAFEERGYLWGA